VRTVCLSSSMLRAAPTMARSSSGGGTAIRLEVAIGFCAGMLIRFPDSETFGKTDPCHHQVGTSNPTRLNTCFKLSGVVIDGPSRALIVSGLIMVRSCSVIAVDVAGILSESSHQASVMPYLFLSSVSSSLMLR